MGSRVSLAHAVGAVFAVVSGGLAAANLPGQSLGLRTSDFIVFGVYLPVAFLACGLRSMRRYNRATAWLGEDRAPTPEEQRRTLRLPFTEATEGMVPWLVAALIWVVMNLALYGSSVAYSARVGLSIVLGGLATSCTSSSSARSGPFLRLPSRARSPSTLAPSACGRG
jgi:adenylate cyclase